MRPTPTAGINGLWPGCVRAAWLCAAMLMLAACGGGGGDKGGPGPAGAELQVAVVFPGASTGQTLFVNSQPSGIDCGLTCSTRFALDTSVTLTAAVPSGFRLSGWGGACSGTVVTCTVRMSGARSVTVTYVVASLASGWTDFELLGAADAGGARVGIDGAGRATAVWLQRDAGVSRRSVWTSRRAPGGEWSAPALLESIDTDFVDVAVAVDASSGRRVAVWRGATSPQVFARAADAAGVWSTPTLINGPGNNINDLQVGIDSSGNAVAVWSQTPSGSTVTSIWSNRAGSAGVWQLATQVAVAEHDRQDLDPSLAVSANGQAFLVWTRNSSDVMASQAGPAGPWSTPSVLAAGAVSTGVAAPRVAADANGHAMAVWAQGARNGSNQIETTLAARRFASGAWQGSAAFLYTPVVTPLLSDVRLSVNGTGQFVAIWAQADASIRAVKTDAAGTWGAAAVVRAAGLELLSPPQIGLDAAGGAYATWVERSASSAGTAELWSNRLTAGGTWLPGAAQRFTPDAAGDPRIAMNDRGDAAIAYLGSGSRVIVYHLTTAR